MKGRKVRIAFPKSRRLFDHKILTLFFKTPKLSWRRLSRNSRREMTCPALTKPVPAISWDSEPTIRLTTKERAS